MSLDKGHVDASGPFGRQVSRREALKYAAAGAMAVPAASQLGRFGVLGRSLAGVRSAAGQKSTLTIAISTTPAGLDPMTYGGLQSGEVYESCYAGILEWKQIPGVVPGSYGVDWSAGPGASVMRLAESMTVNGAQTVYTFKLRPGLMSHAGNELTSADVTWTYARSKAIVGIESSLNVLDNIVDVRAVDKYTIQYVLSRPTPNFPIDLCDYSYRSVLDSTAILAHATKKDPWGTAWLANNTAGWGPYKLASLIPGTSYTLTAVPGWPWPAKIPQVVCQVTPDSSERLALLARGAVDVTQELLPTELEELSTTSGVKVWNFPSNNLAALSIGFQFKPLDDVRVRQALAYAVPYQGIVQEVYLGYAEQAYGPLPSYSPKLVDKSLWPYKLDYKHALVSC